MDATTPAEYLETQQIRDLVRDAPSEGRFEVSRHVYTDPRIFELEMQRIFSRTWVYLGHESQLPRAGDFLATQIGRQPVLLTRDDAGDLHAFLNACSHRGARLTTSRRGNRQSLMCPYHGWVYALDGRCVDVNQQATGNYPAYFEQADKDLRRLARLESHRGFVFGSLSSEVPTLTEHLGEGAAFIDLFVDQSPQGLEVLRGGVHYTCEANWKLQLENPDAYHFFPVHMSYIGLAQKRVQESDDRLKVIDVSDMKAMPGGIYDLGNGHSVGWTQMPNGEERPLAAQRERITEAFGAERARWMIDCVRAQLVFPNLWLMDQASTTLRVVHPLAPGLTRMEVYCIAPVGEPAAARQLRLRQFEDFLGPAGLATPDDQVVMEQCQRGYAAGEVEWGHPFARGNAALVQGPDAAATALGLNPRASAGIEDELLCHGSYREWLRLMSRD